MQQLIRWRGAIYLACAVLVAWGLANTGLVRIANLLGNESVSGLYRHVPRALWGYGSLIPGEAYLALGYDSALFMPMIAVAQASFFLLLAAAARRAWLALRRGERVPPAFEGRLIWVAAAGLATFALCLVAIPLQAFGFQGRLLLLPAEICIPWAFFLTELRSLRRGHEEWTETQPADLEPEGGGTSPERPSLGSIAGRVLGRMAVVAVAFVVASAAALVSGLPYGGGEKSLFFLAALVLFAGFGWSLLPLVHASRRLAVVLLALWAGWGLVLGFMPSSAGEQWFGTWIVATMVLGCVELRRRGGVR